MIDIKERINKILGKTNLKTLNGEADILEFLKSIKDEENEIQGIILEKTLDYIEKYFYIKNKFILCDEDNSFMNNLSEEMKQQKIRKTDGVVYDPLFKVITEDGTEKYFLTRNGAKNFQKNCAIPLKSEIIEVEENDNSDLSKIIEIIKRNY